MECSLNWASLQAHAWLQFLASFSATNIGATMIVLWLLLEILFFVVLYFVILPKLHQLNPPVPYHEDIVDMMKKCLHQIHLLDNYTFKMFVEGSFNAADDEEVYHENYRSFL
mgnify:CR=1 FL=1